MIPLLILLLGLLVGYYARQLYDMVKDLHDKLVEERQREVAGVVRPVRSRATRNEPISLESSPDSGVVMRPSPLLSKLSEQNSIDELNKKLKRNV